jgi:hypothetical protein
MSRVAELCLVVRLFKQPGAGCVGALSLRLDRHEQCCMLGKWQVAICSVYACACNARCRVLMHAAGSWQMQVCIHAKRDMLATRSSLWHMLQYSFSTILG